MKYQKYYTAKEWNRLNRCFDKEINGQKYHKCTQEILCNKYDIIITDYMTQKEKIVKVLKKINVQNINKFLDTIKPAAPSSHKQPKIKTPKLKKVDYSFLFSRPVQKPKKRRARKKAKKSADYSFLSSKKVKFF